MRDLLSLGVEVAVADPDAEARSFARSAGATIAAGDAAELSGYSGAVVATPTVTHASVARGLLSSGVPIFIEKPMTNDPADADQLAAVAGNRVFVMDKWRYHPGVEELRAIHQSGELGATLGMRLRHVGWGLPHRDVDVGWILSPHCLSIVLEVLGQIPAPRHAFGERLNGNLVGLAGLLGTAPWVCLEVSSRAPVKSRQFELHGERGVAWLDDGWADHIKVARGRDGKGGDAGEVEVRPVSRDLPLLRELTAFVRHIEGGPPPRSSAAEGAEVVRRIHELRRLAGDCS